MLLCRGKDEYCIRWRFFQCFQQGVKCTGTEHVHLVDDIHTVLAHLRRYTHLVYQTADIVHAVVRRGIQLMDIERTLLVECFTRLALVARIVGGCRILTVDGLGKDSCTGRFAYASRAAEQVGVCQFTLTDGITQCLGQGVLTNYALERAGSVLSR